MTQTIRPEVRSELERQATPAILIGRDYRILATNRAYAERYGKAVRHGVHRCHEISHGYDTPCDQNGEDCPLQASLRSARVERVLHVHHGPEGPEHCDIELRPLHDEDGSIDQFIEVIKPVEIATPTIGPGMVGRDPAFNRVVGLIRRVAPSDVPVLLLGESGTGKELAARAVHDASVRGRGPFVPLECSGLSESLFESELFGHEKGSFTGASRKKIGLVEAARGGTLFLDEIGDVPLGLQVKLLRLLESGRFRPVGAVDESGADFRLVCATHRDLAQMVREGTFRKDLYYRISAFPVRVPPLRERRRDVSLLARAFLERLEPRRRLSESALACMEKYAWPGNVRELRNVLQRAVLLADDEEILPDHLPDEVCRAGASPEEPSSKVAGPVPAELLPLEEVQRRYLRWAAATFEGSRKDLADRLGLSERTLYRRLGEV